MTLRLFVFLIAVTAPVCATSSPISAANGSFPVHRREIFAQTSACGFDTSTVAHVRDIMVNAVTADTGGWLDDVRAAIDVPRAPEDSVLTITSASTCDRARSAYRTWKFGVDTGWINKVVVCRIKNRYAIYGGEITPNGLKILIMDLRWRYKATY